MVNTESSAPINKLNQDVLHEIFTINTHGELPLDAESIPADHDLSPLVIIRRTSHVCVLWRDIILRSPAIWARCIDFDALGQRDNHWRDLVLQRTGDVLLSVTTTVMTPRLLPQSGLETFFFKTLDLYWHRIREINLSLNFSDIQDIRIMELFSRPAPNLETFMLHTETFEPDEDLGSQRLDDMRLFSDNAPSLRYFSCPELLCYSPVIISPFFSSKMRYLDLQSPFNTTATDLLNACLQMPLLETLIMKISTFDLGDMDPNRLPWPLMPQLNSLEIKSSSFGIYTWFMDRITPAQGCSLTMQHDISDVVDITRKQLEDMQNTLFRYASAFLASHKDWTKIELFLDRNNFAFGCGEEEFVLDIYLVDDDAAHLPVEMLTRLLDIVSNLHFPSMVYQMDNLYVDLYYNSRTDGGTRLGIPLVLPKTIKTLNSMDWIMQLALRYYPALRCIHEITVFHLLFPALTTLCIKAVPDNAHFGGQIMMSYLVNRQNYKPLKVLKFDFKEETPQANISFLDQLSGLTLAWKGRDDTAYQYYKCGVDDPGRLLLEP